jgi:pimeloyl-ACP methyl ester carboxylesterase
MCRESHPWYRHQHLMSLAALLRMLEGCDIRPAAATLKMPVLVLAGDRDPIVPPQQAQWLAHHIPRANLRLFGDTGHCPQIEEVETCVQIMLNWLQEHPV